MCGKEGGRGGTLGTSQVPIGTRLKKKTHIVMRGLSDRPPEKVSEILLDAFKRLHVFTSCL